MSAERAFSQADLDREVPQPPNVIPIGRARVRKPPEPHAETVRSTPPHITVICSAIVDCPRPRDLYLIQIRSGSGMRPGSEGSPPFPPSGGWELGRIRGVPVFREVCPPRASIRGPIEVAANRILRNGSTFTRGSKLTHHAWVKCDSPAGGA